MEKLIILMGAALAIPAPGAWAQSAQAGPGQAQQVERQAKIIDDPVIAEYVNRNPGSGTFVYVGGQMLNGKPVTGQPYSAEAVTETTQMLADGNRIVTHLSSMMYRDSEGRERREESIGKLGAWTAQGEPAKVVFISDPVARVNYTLHTEDRTAEKMPAPGVSVKVLLDDAAQTVAAAQGGRGAGVGIGGGRGGAFNVNTVVTAGGVTTTTGVTTVGDVGIAYQASAEAGAAAGGRGGRGGRGGAAAKVENLGSQSVEGVMAEGTRTSQTIPAGQIGNERDINIVSERWYSPDLQMVVMTKRSDPRSGETVYKLTNVIRSEPAHSMFEVPADYTISDSASMREEKLRQEKLQLRKEDQ